MEDLILSVKVPRGGIYLRRSDKVQFVAEGKDPNGLILLESLLDETDRIAVSLDFLLGKFDPIEAGPSPREVFAAMIQFGGGFVQRLGDAGLHADPEQRDVIKNAWPVFWERYSQLAENADPLIPEDLPEEEEEGAE